LIKKAIITLLLLLLTVVLLSVLLAGDREWDKTFGGTDYDAALSIIQTSGGGYVLVGHTSPYGVGKYDAWLIKTLSPLTSASILTLISTPAETVENRKI
jgi:hypothetical protein